MLLTKEEYVSKKGLYCPHCGSRDLETMDTNTKDNGIDQTVQCDKCKRTWVENYALVGVDFSE